MHATLIEVSIFRVVRVVASVDLKNFCGYRWSECTVQYVTFGIDTVASNACSETALK